MKQNKAPPRCDYQHPTYETYARQVLGVVLRSARALGAGRAYEDSTQEVEQPSQPIDSSWQRVMAAWAWMHGGGRATRPPFSIGSPVLLCISVAEAVAVAERRDESRVLAEVSVVFLVGECLGMLGCGP